MTASAEPPAGGRPGWFPDPWGRWDLRWHNGAQWTADVSSDGRRFVDPLGTSGATVVAGTGERSGAAAVALGALALTFAWMPVFVVFGVVSALAAVIVAMRARTRMRRAGAPTPRLVRIGLILGSGAMVVAVFGVWLTTVFVGEVRRYTEIGPYAVEVTSCTVVDEFAVAEGRITNRSDGQRDYRVVVSLLDRFRSVATIGALVYEVDPGATGSFTVRSFVGDLDAGDLACEVDDVTGPLPFGVDLGFDVSS